MIMPTVKIAHFSKHRGFIFIVTKIFPIRIYFISIKDYSMSTEAGTNQELQNNHS